MRNAHASQAGQWVSARFGASFSHFVNRQIIAATDKSNKRAEKAATTIASFFNSLWINTMNRCFYPQGEAQP
jgi:hypothetical protein